MARVSMPPDSRIPVQFAPSCSGSSPDDLRSSSMFPAVTKCSAASCSSLTRARKMKLDRVVVATMIAETRPKADHEFHHNNERSSSNGRKSSKSLSTNAGKPGNGKLATAADSPLVEQQLKPVSVRDYMEQSLEMIKPDGGPPRWFCPLECGQPAQEHAPVLLFLPGMEGTGLGLLLHHRALGELFEVRCFHIPVKDRTPFEGLLKSVEDAVRSERRRRPSSPIYLLGDSFGATLALAVAARNPSIDIVLVLANPATSIDRSPLQPLFPVLGAIPNEAFQFFPYMLSFAMGDALRMASAGVTKNWQQPLQSSQALAEALSNLLPTLPNLAKILPKDTLLWKLSLIRAGALYANSRLHAVRAQVLVLASGKDQLLPSVDEAQRLKKAVRNCRVRIFKESGHTLLLEDGLNLATTIKATLLYRRSKERNAVTDYVPPTKREFEAFYDATSTLRRVMSPVFLSTNEQGQVIKGLSGIPNDRPVILVGNHMLMGIELSLFVGEVLRERNVLLRGLAHPVLFSNQFQTEYTDQSFNDQIGLFGAIPVNGKNFYELLSNKASVLLYPGGAREALHMKGEEYKLFWPEKSEFVRMAARFGATIIPFSCVGEDDAFELLLDYEDMRKNAFLRNTLVLTPSSTVRSEADGEVANQPLYLPVLAPKIPGRFYFFCSKPIFTEGRWDELQDREKAKELYSEVKHQVESGISYLLNKREQDPFRRALPRLIYEASWRGTRQGPSFQT